MIKQNLRTKDVDEMDNGCIKYPQILQMHNINKLSRSTTKNWSQEDIRHLEMFYLILFDVWNYLTSRGVKQGTRKEEQINNY